MLEKLLNQQVGIGVTTYGHTIYRKGVLTAIDTDYVELDNNTLIPIKFIYEIVKK